MLITKSVILFSVKPELKIKSIGLTFVYVLSVEGLHHTPTLPLVIVSIIKGKVVAVGDNNCLTFTCNMFNGLYSASKSEGIVDTPIAEISGAENSLPPI